MFTTLTSFITILILLITFSAGFSQTSIGLTGGLNISTLSISDPIPEADFSSVPGIIVGFVINRDLSENYSLSFQPRYIQKGQDIKPNLTFLPDFVENRFNYLELPIYFRVKMNLNELCPYIFTGINIGYLYSSTSTSRYYDQVNTIYTTGQYKEFDFCIDFGVGLAYNFFGKYTITFDARYSYGLVDINPDEGTVKTRGKQIVIGFLYSL